MNLSKTTTNELLYVGFNQDYGCFACGTDTGFRIYNCNPFKETFRRDFSSGGIGLVEMLFRCNILALVGGGRNPRYPTDKVMIWDDHQNRCIGELSFRNEVKAVKLRRDKVVVILQNKIYVYNFADLKLIDHIETVHNPKGLCAVCPSATTTVLACPALRRGHVRVELYDIRKTTFIPAHEADLACLALNTSGTRLATASDKGTLIRVFDTSSGEQLQELRRGADRAEIYCICFNPDSSMIACSSDKGTVHIFKLTGSALVAGATATEDTKDDADIITPVPAATAPMTAAVPAVGPTTGGASGGAAAATGGGAATSARPEDTEDDRPGGEDGGNATSTFAFMKGILPKYFSSEWSFAQYRVHDTARQSICAFGSDPNTIIVVSADGTFSKANFERGGEAVRTSFARFIKSDAAPTKDG